MGACSLPATTSGIRAIVVSERTSMSVDLGSMGDGSEDKVVSLTRVSSPLALGEGKGKVERDRRKGRACEEVQERHIFPGNASWLKEVSVSPL